MRGVGFFACCLIAFFAAGFASADVVYNPATDFEAGFTTQTNPNGVWSYGYSSTAIGAVTLFTQTLPTGAINGPNTQLWVSPVVNIGDSPAMEFNDGPAFNNGNVNFLANELVLVAGLGGQYSDLVFTAPTTGTYSISGDFRGDQAGIGTTANVAVNGAPFFLSPIVAEGQTATFSDAVLLHAGDTVEFSVGPGGGTQNTGLDATITYFSSSAPLPSPISAGLVLLFGVGVAGVLRRSCRSAT